MIAKPFSPGNAFPADEVAREHLTFDKAMIGSCTNGSYDDLLQAALVLKAARDRGAKKVEREFAIFPGSGGVKARSSSRIRGLAASRSRKSSARSAADPPVVVRPLLRPGPRRALQGQRAITSFNRNWQNRMGLGGEGYLASPAVVAASALAWLHGAAVATWPRPGTRTLMGLTRVMRVRPQPVARARARRSASVWALGLALGIGRRSAGGSLERNGDRPFRRSSPAQLTRPPTCRPAIMIRG